MKFRKLSEIQFIAGIVITITVCCEPNQSLVGDIEGILHNFKPNHFASLLDTTAARGNFVSLTTWQMT